MCQKLLCDIEEKLVEFQRYLIKKQLEKGYILGQIGNADQMPVYFYVPVAYMVNDKEPKEIKV